LGLRATDQEEEEVNAVTRICTPHQIFIPSNQGETDRWRVSHVGWREKWKVGV